jgi:ribulose 1,5-bisphosphate synthetase/thiazole synthase
MRTHILTCVLPLAIAGVVQRRSNDEVDYIVVGGGTSGLVVAKRL